MLWHNNRHIHRYFIIVIILSLHTVNRSFYKEHTSANYSDFQASCNGKPKSVERHLHTLMCLVSVVTVVFIHTMEDDQRLNTLVHEGDALRFSVYHCKKPENRCNSKVTCYNTEEVYQVRSISYINQFTMKSLVVAIIISGIRRMSRGA